MLDIGRGTLAHGRYQLGDAEIRAGIGADDVEIVDHATLGVADRDLQALLGCQSTLQHLVARHADADHIVRPHCFTDGCEHFQREADAVGEAAAVAVAAAVHHGRPELVGQVGRAGDLDAVYTALLRPQRRCRERLLDTADVLDLQLLGKGAVLQFAQGRGRDGGQPVAGIPTGAAPGMGHLDHQGAAMGVDALGELPQDRHHAVVTQIDLAERSRAVGGDAGRTAEHGQRQTALGLLLMVELVALPGQPVLDIVGRVRRAHHPVLECQVLQPEGLQQRVGGGHREQPPGRACLIYAGRPGGDLAHATPGCHQGGTQP